MNIGQLLEKQAGINFGNIGNKIKGKFGGAAQAFEDSLERVNSGNPEQPIDRHILNFMSAKDRAGDGFGNFIDSQEGKAVRNLGLLGGGIGLLAPRKKDEDDEEVTLKDRLLSAGIGGLAGMGLGGAWNSKGSDLLSYLGYNPGADVPNIDGSELINK